MNITSSIRGDHQDELNTAQHFKTEKRLYETAKKCPWRCPLMPIYQEWYEIADNKINKDTNVE